MGLIWPSVEIYSPLGFPSDPLKNTPHSRLEILLRQLISGIKRAKLRVRKKTDKMVDLQEQGWMVLV